MATIDHLHSDAVFLGCLLHFRNKISITDKRGLSPFSRGQHHTTKGPKVISQTSRICRRLPNSRTQYEQSVISLPPVSCLHPITDHEAPVGTNGALHFLVRDPLYNTVKPYTIQYEPHGDIPRTNIKGVSIPEVHIRDLRPSLSNLSFEKDGAIVKSLDSKLQYEEFGDPKKVQKVYLEEVRLVLQEALASHNVAVVEYLVSQFLSHKLLRGS